MSSPFPSRLSLSIGDLADCVYSHGAYLKRNFDPADLADPSDSDSTPGSDVRLQVHAGSWSFHTGDSCYDQDHRGAWGAGFCPLGVTRKEAREIARDLIDQARSDYDESDD